MYKRSAALDEVRSNQEAWAIRHAASYGGRFVHLSLSVTRILSATSNICNNGSRANGENKLSI